METVVLLFLLTSLDRPGFRENLRDFLGFYRENRDLIVSLFRTAPMSPPPADGAPACGTAPSGANESRPPEEAGKDLFQEFLRRAAV